MTIVPEGSATAEGAKHALLHYLLAKERFNTGECGEAQVLRARAALFDMLGKHAGAFPDLRVVLDDGLIISMEVVVR